MASDSMAILEVMLIAPCKHSSMQTKQKTKHNGAYGATCTHHMCAPPSVAASLLLGFSIVVKFVGHLLRSVRRADTQATWPVLNLRWLNMRWSMETAAG